MSDLTKQEQIAYEEFSQTYTLAHPAPVLRHVQGIGWEFWIALIWSLSAVIVATVRTASEFYRIEVESGIDPILATASAFLALVAFEGGLIFASILKSSKEKKYNPQFLLYGTLLTMMISVAAGLNSSIGGLPEESQWIVNAIRWVEVTVIGVGASFLAFISSEVVGAQIAVAFSNKDSAEDELRDAMSKWREELNSAWVSSSEREVARQGKRIEQIKARSAVRSVAERTNERSEQNEEDGSFGERTPNEHRTNERRTTEQNERRTKICEFIRSVYESDGRIPGPTEISNSLKCSKGYAHQIREEWMKENSTVL